MKVRKAGKTDFVEVHKLILSIFPSANMKLGEKDEFLVAEDYGTITGFAHFYEDEKRIILKGFGVAERSRKYRGVGGAILDALISHAKKAKKSVFLKTKVRNPALRLYYKKGFCFKRLKGETITMVYRIAN